MHALIVFEVLRSMGHVLIVVTVSNLENEDK